MYRAYGYNILPDRRSGAVDNIREYHASYTRSIRTYKYVVRVVYKVRKTAVYCIAEIQERSDDVLGTTDLVSPLVDETSELNYHLNLDGTLSLSLFRGIKNFIYSLAHFFVVHRLIRMNVRIILPRYGLVGIYIFRYKIAFDVTAGRYDGDIIQRGALIKQLYTI